MTADGLWMELHAVMRVEWVLECLESVVCGAGVGKGEEGDGRGG